MRYANQFTLTMLLASIAAASGCKTTGAADTSGATNGSAIKTLPANAFDINVPGGDSSSFTARLYRALETGASSMQDAGIAAPIRSETALSVAWQGQFVSCDVASKAPVVTHTCHVSTETPSMSWTSDESSLQAVLYRTLVIAQGGLGVITLIGNDGASLECERRRALGDAQYRCAFNIPTGQDSR